jgi:putative addiction module CopG family antidote
MNVTLQPATERFIDEQIKAGRFATAEAVIEAAIAGLREGDDLDDATIAAINEAEAEADRGEGVDLDTFRSQFLNRVSAR